jgi:hypothetical protein
MSAAPTRWSGSAYSAAKPVQHPRLFCIAVFIAVPVLGYPCSLRCGTTRTFLQ